MHGAARDLAPMHEGLMLGVEPRECRQQTGMDVDDSIGKLGEKLPRKQAHESRETDPFDAVQLQAPCKLELERGAIGVVARGNSRGREPTGSRSLEASRFGAVADHHDDLRRDVTALAPFGKRLHVATAPRDQHADACQPGSWSAHTAPPSSGKTPRS